jgi:hypothetical protein
MADKLTSWRHLYFAVLALSTDAGAIEERLRIAYSAISQIPPPHDGSSYLKDELHKLSVDLADFLRDGQVVDAKRASRIAKQIVMLYDKVTKDVELK